MHHLHVLADFTQAIPDERSGKHHVALVDAGLHAGVGVVERGLHRGGAGAGQPRQVRACGADLVAREIRQSFPRTGGDDVVVAGGGDREEPLSVFLELFVERRELVVEAPRYLDGVSRIGRGEGNVVAIIA